MKLRSLTLILLLLLTSLLGPFITTGPHELPVTRALVEIGRLDPPIRGAGPASPLRPTVRQPSSGYG